MECYILKNINNKFHEWHIAKIFMVQNYRWSVRRVLKNLHSISRFENLHEESLQFIDYLNKSSILKPRWDNPTKHGVTSAAKCCDYYKQLPPRLIQSLVQKYQKDFKLFEYESASYLNKCEFNFSP